MTDPWVTENKGEGPWTFEKQQAKYGYRNNPRWVDVAGVGVETLSPVWPMDDKVMSAGVTKGHKPCGYWFGEPAGNISGSGSGWDADIGYTTQQMSANGVQTLVRIGGGSCNWEWVILSGGGTITQDGVYTAPATNSNCADNPVIGLLCRGVIVATLEIAVNAYPTLGVTAWYCCHQAWNIYYSCSMGITCEGTVFGPYMDEAHTRWNDGHGGYNYCTCGWWTAGGCGSEEGEHDVRTETMLDEGCCPMQLL